MTWRPRWRACWSWARLRCGPSRSSGRARRRGRPCATRTATSSAWRSALRATDGPALTAELDCKYGRTEEEARERLHASRRAFVSGTAEPAHVEPHLAALTPRRAARD